MKYIAVTQRVAIDEATGERRDCLDRKWTGFLLEAGLIPILIPNDRAAIELIAEGVELCGALLTGGNSLGAYGGDAPDRDAAEKFLLEYCVLRGLPIAGICRGMQFIQHYFEVPLIQIDGHVATKHSVTVGGARREVNSYHRWGTRDTADCLEVVANAPDGIVEAVRHRTLPIEAAMWHPERFEPFAAEDIRWFKRLFASE